METAELIEETRELENTLEGIFGEGVYDDILEEYHKNALTLRGSHYISDRLEEIQKEYNSIERRLPYVSSVSFNRYIHLGNLIAVMKELR